MGLIINPTDYDDFRWVGHAKATGPNSPARTAINGTTIEVWEFTSKT